jgi:hypothetical protein
MQITVGAALSVALSVLICFSICLFVVLLVVGLMFSCDTIIDSFYVVTSDPGYLLFVAIFTAFLWYSWFRLGKDKRKRI